MIKSLKILGEQLKRGKKPLLPLRLILSLFSLFFLVQVVYADIILTASWYSLQSLKNEGTYKRTRAVMANGQKFSDNNFTCATQLYPLGSYLLVSNLSNGKSIIVKVTDRISKRFAKTRIDLSKGAFQILAPLSKGLIQVKVERIK